MKILRLLTTAALAVLISTVVYGCDDGNSPASPAPVGEKQGRVIIPLPKNPAQNARSVEFETVQTYTNFYEAIFTKDDVSLSVTAEEGAEQIEINIAEGVYTILLAAGCKSGLATPLLLASGYVEGRAINAGENIVEITLKLIAVDITAPEEVVQDQTFDMQVDVDTKNPFVKLTSLPLSFNPVGSKIDSTDFSNNGDVYTWKYEITAPSTTGNITAFIAHSFNIVPKSSWYIGYYNATNTHFKDVKDNYKKTITVAADGDLPKVNLVIKWEN
ncbi:MAG: hypothetical protein LBE74_02730 [Treponema sp.]|jgi:hypothetical protein|nr:hypothetical protein [Treponema sp.]